MSTISRAILILALLALSTLAHSDGIFNPGGRGINGFEGPLNGGAPIPQPTGKILLADGVSHLLQADGISKICRAGGC